MIDQKPELPYQNRVAQLQDDNATVEDIVQSVMDLLEYRIEDMRGLNLLHVQNELSSVADVLTRLAETTEDARTIVDVARDEARKISVRTRGGISADRICDVVCPPIEQRVYEQAEITDTSELVVESNGVAFDTYLENNLDTVTELEPRNTGRRETLHWEFKDDTVVVTRGNEHRSFSAFYRVVAAATDTYIRRELLSERVLQNAPGDPETSNHARTVFGDMSVGDANRPWSRRTWRHAIHDLIEERNKQHSADEKTS